jgi:cyclopentanol dehydrogenase
MREGLSDKVVLVTGAARGLGLAYAGGFVRAGARVILSDILDEEGSQAATQLGRTGAAAYRRLDVSEPEQWRAVVDEALASFGRLDVLVNNAGIVRSEDAVTESLEGWRQVWSVNATGTFLGLKHAVPAMQRSGGGSIVNVASSWALIGSPGYISYIATKGAVLSMTRSAALSYARLGIRVNCVCPGLVDTPMANSVSPVENEQVVHDTPLGRMAQPGDVVGAVLFLASDEASYCTGMEIVVDGGHIVP